MRSPYLPRSHSSRGPVIVTASALRRDHPALVAQLEAAGCTFSWVTQWAQLLHAEDVATANILLVDLDAANRASANAPVAPSGYRVTKLLARATRTAGTLVVLTTLDFAEIEDLAHAGVRAFLDPRLNAEECASRILATAAARTTGPLGRIPVEVGTYVGMPPTPSHRAHPGA